eukprot:gene5793-11695_t
MLPKTVLSKLKQTTYLKEKLEDIVIEKPAPRPLFLNISRLVIRCSWISWWVQIILSVISAVILTFANTVRSTSANQSIWVSGFSFTGIGIVISFLNTFWTWNITKLCRRVVANKIDDSSVISTFQKYFSIAIGLSLLGSFITLIGAEQIVGTLASKALSMQGFQPYSLGSSVPNTLQALDIFLVQANTNALVAHFAPTLCYSLLQTQLTSKNVSQTNSEILSQKSTSDEL